jgi:hypothetical protein
MGVLTLSEERHLSLCHFRRNAWKAVFLCAALRFADTTFSFGLVDPAPPLSAAENYVLPASLENSQ